MHKNAATMSCFLRFHSHVEWLLALSTREFLKLPHSSIPSSSLSFPSVYKLVEEEVVGIKGLVSVQIKSSSYHRCRASDTKSPNEESFNHDGNYIMRKLKSYWMKTEIWRDLASERTKVIAMKVGNSIGGSNVNSHTTMLRHLIEGRVLPRNRYSGHDGEKRTSVYSESDRTLRKKDKVGENSTNNGGRRRLSATNFINSSSYHYYPRKSRNYRDQSPRSKNINQIQMPTTKMYAMKLREPEHVCDESLFRILSGVDNSGNADATYSNDRSQMEPLCDPNSRVSLFSSRLEMEMVRIGYGHQVVQKKRKGIF